MSYLNSNVNNRCDNCSSIPNQTLRILLVEWLYKNVRLEGDIPGLIALSIFLILSWLIIGWLLKLIMAMLWPLCLVIFLIVLYPCIQENGMGIQTIIIPKVVKIAKEIYSKFVLFLSKLIFNY